ncbi:MAG: ATP-binding protein [Candidatus Micrarchaeia archaeon]
MIDKTDIIDYLREFKTIEAKIFARDLKVPLDSEFIIAIYGPRRAGKTYYFFQLMRSMSNPLYLNFEDSRLREINYKELRDVIRHYIEEYKTEPKELLLDEIQNISSWEIAVRELSDLKKYRIFITGSSSRMLSKEILTQLRGRSLSYLMLPFSFGEVIRLKGISTDHISRDEVAKIKGELAEYIDFGGFPAVVLSNDESEMTKILREYSDLVLFKDFVERHNIKSIDLARYIQESILHNFSSEISANAIFKKAKSTGIKVSKNTIYDYLEKLEDTAFFFFLARYSEKAHERSTWPKKVYLADTGLSKALRFSEDKGKLIENAVFLELLRSKNVDPLVEVYYLKDTNEEVDFLVKKGAKISELIQVTYKLDDSNYKREVNPLIKFGKELGVTKLLIITWDQEEEINKDGLSIKVIALWKWLLIAS